MIFFLLHNKKKMKHKNMFISFEGLDGAGKGEQIIRLLALIKDDTNGFLGDKYTSVWLTREPTKLTLSGRQISKGIRKGDISGEEASEMFIKDRIEHTQKYILPSLRGGSFVLVDRYDISTYAYQMAQGMDFDFIYNAHNYNGCEGAIVPDITIVLDVPVSVAMDRICKRKSVIEQFEVDTFQEKVFIKQEEAIARLMEKQPKRLIVRINANQTIENVTAEIVNKLLAIFP